MTIAQEYREALRVHQEDLKRFTKRLHSLLYGKWKFQPRLNESRLAKEWVKTYDDAVTAMRAAAVAVARRGNCVVYEFCDGSVLEMDETPGRDFAPIFVFESRSARAAAKHGFKKL